MPGAYSVRVVALAVDESPKWLDNLLSHHRIFGVSHDARGVARQLSEQAALAIAICKTLTRSLGVPMGNAVPIANEVVAGASEGVIRISASVELRVAVDAVRLALNERLVDAMESVAHIRRGRPRLRAGGE